MQAEDEAIVLFILLAIVLIVSVSFYWVSKNWKYVWRIILQSIKRKIKRSLNNQYEHLDEHQDNHLRRQSHFSSRSSQHRKNLSTSRLAFTRNSHQDDERRFGEYKCHHCGRKWTSAYSWVNMGQECKTCYTNVLPCRQEGMWFVSVICYFWDRFFKNINMAPDLSLLYDWWDHFLATVNGLPSLNFDNENYHTHRKAQYKILVRFNLIFWSMFLSYYS